MVAYPSPSGVNVSTPGPGGVLAKCEPSPGVEGVAGWDPPTTAWTSVPTASASLSSQLRLEDTFPFLTLLLFTAAPVKGQQS